MDAVVSLTPHVELSDDERAAIARLSNAVYPPDEWADWPGRFIEWSDPEWCVRITREGELLSYTGIVLRSGLLSEQKVLIGGVGGIKTHLNARGAGYAREGVNTALAFFDRMAVDFALLVCEPHLLSYYSRIGWQEFHGQLLVTQRGVVEEFTFNRVMTHPVGAPAPMNGRIHLCGPPW